MPSHSATILQQWTYAARIGLSFGETVQFLQQYCQVPGRLHKTTPWISNISLVCVGCDGVAQEWRVRKIKAKNTIEWGDNIHSWIIVALYISYIFQGILGMSQLRFGERFSKNRLFARCQFVALCAMNILPLVKDTSEWLCTRKLPKSRGTPTESLEEN